VQQHLLRSARWQQAHRREGGQRGHVHRRGAARGRCEVLQQLLMLLVLLLVVVVLPHCVQGAACSERATSACRLLLHRGAQPVTA
jgi:hypothetical protein